MLLDQLRWEEGLLYRKKSGTHKVHIYIKSTIVYVLSLCPSPGTKGGRAPTGEGLREKKA